MDACQDLETQGQESRNREAGRNLNLRRFSVNEGAKLADYDEIKIDRLFLQPYFFCLAILWHAESKASGLRTYAVCPKRCYILPARSNLKIDGENSYHLRLLWLRLRPVSARGGGQNCGVLPLARPSHVQGKPLHQGLAGGRLRRPSGKAHPSTTAQRRPSCQSHMG